MGPLVHDGPGARLLRARVGRLGVLRVARLAPARAHQLALYVLRVVLFVLVLVVLEPLGHLVAVLVRRNACFRLVHVCRVETGQHRVRICLHLSKLVQTFYKEREREQKAHESNRLRENIELKVYFLPQQQHRHHDDRDEFIDFSIIC
ncbi:hypothetical protein BpHYR1_044514 [Brachionus plicatilis]|uniref:Uncharacterized protein n=1 Tax=Brachionus plicatilis TaxID=10195 RepID=A0A3M7SYU4_BRAPC|nr:hypothetical protein BpHYR1_044514 [Brachionus plicatilis]